MKAISGLRNARQWLDLHSFSQACRVTLSNYCKGSASVINVETSNQKSYFLIPQLIPDRPWERVRVDIFSLYGKDYLIAMNYYSKYPEVGLLKGKQLFL